MAFYKTKRRLKTRKSRKRYKRGGAFGMFWSARGCNGATVNPGLNKFQIIGPNNKYISNAFSAYCAKNPTTGPELSVDEIMKIYLKLYIEGMYIERGDAKFNNRKFVAMGLNWLNQEKGNVTRQRMRELIKQIDDESYIRKNYEQWVSQKGIRDERLKAIYKQMKTIIRDKDKPDEDPVYKELIKEKDSLLKPKQHFDQFEANIKSLLDQSFIKELNLS